MEGKLREAFANTEKRLVMSYPEQYEEFAKVTYEMLHMHKVKSRAYGAAGQHGS